MKHSNILVFIPCLFASFTPLASGTQCSSSGETGQITSVLKQRDLFNQAIVDKDIKAIESVLHEDVILITGTDSDVYTGIEAQLAIWSDDFSKPDRAVYKRTPMCVRVSPVYPVALEYGTWRGEQSDNTGNFAAGSYAAKWRLVGAHWQLESEVFATESCGGGFCAGKKYEEVNLPLAYEGYTGIYEGFTLKLDERFDIFDNSAWVTGDGAVGKESACRFQPQGVEVAGGLLNLIVRKEPIDAGWSEDHEKEKSAYQFSCGELRSHNSKRVRYGRFETRMKAPAREVASGYISSLFTYNFEGEQPEWEEIDVELEGGRPDKFQANLIYGRNTWAWSGTRQWGAWEDKIDIGPVDEWRVYAIEWRPDEIKWYVDGVLVKTLKQSALDCKPACVPPQVNPTPIPDNTTDLMMNFWIPNDQIQNNFGGNKKNNVYPMRAQYDWLRIYQLDEEPFSDW